MIILIRQITNSYLIKNYEGLGSSRQHRTFCTHRRAGHAQNHQQGGKRNICFFISNTRWMWSIFLEATAWTTTARHFRSAEPWTTWSSSSFHLRGMSVHLWARRWQKFFRWFSLSCKRWDQWKLFRGPNSFLSSIVWVVYVGHGWVLLLPGDPLHQQVRALHQQTQRGVGIGNGSHRVRTFPFWSFYSLL